MSVSYILKTFMPIAPSWRLMMCYVGWHTETRERGASLVSRHTCQSPPHQSDCQGRRENRWRCVHVSCQRRNHQSTMIPIKHTFSSVLWAIPVVLPLTIHIVRGYDTWKPKPKARLRLYVSVRLSPLWAMLSPFPASGRRGLFLVCQRVSLCSIALSKI